MVVIVAIIVPHSSIPYKPKVRLPTLHAGCIMVCLILRMYYCTLSPEALVHPMQFETSGKSEEQLQQGQGSARSSDQGIRRPGFMVICCCSSYLNSRLLGYVIIIYG